MIERLTSTSPADAADLAALLADAVDGGASVGFYSPLDPALAAGYWRGVADALATGNRVLLVTRAGGQIVGTVQLDLVTKPTSTHRAEVMKLLVHSAHRGRGLGAALMTAAEDTARELGRTLLVLDARTGDPACRLYERLGYVATGVVPRYAANSAGGRDDCTFYHKELVAIAAGTRGSGGTAAGRANR